MIQRFAAILLILGAAAVTGAGQASPASIATLGIQELVFEVPHVWRIGGDDNNALPSSGRGIGVFDEMDSGSANYKREVLRNQLIVGDIYLLNRQDAKPRLFVSGASHPAWSPDGSQLAYCKWKGLQLGQIEVVNADGTGRRELTSMRGGACFPDWSPDGRKIVFTALSPGDSEKNLLDSHGLVAKSAELFVVDKNGGDPTPITAGYAARWSPAGSLLIFLRRSEKKGSEDSIWLGTADGKQTKMVAASDQVIRGAAWLPSGRGIVASYMRDGNYAIYRFYLDGSQPQGAPPQRIGGNGRTNWSEPTLSRDEKHLMAVEGDRVVLLNLDTNQEMMLASGTYYSVVWEGK